MGCCKFRLAFDHLHRAPIYCRTIFSLFCRSKVVICSIIGVTLSAIILRKIYLRKKQERIERKLKEALEKARRERKQQSRTKPRELREDQKCIVCIENPKEIICLPCGHVCLCEDCSSKIHLSCPVCRANIDSKAAAFIS